MLQNLYCQLDEHPKSAWRKASLQFILYKMAILKCVMYSNIYFCLTRSYFMHSFQWQYYSILSADPPKITQHPKDQLVITGANVAFQVEATGDDLHFQWQKNQSDLYDDKRYCGTQTNTLRIVEVEMSDKGRYRCLVKNCVGKEFSDEPFLTVSKWIIFGCWSGAG